MKYWVLYVVNGELQIGDGKITEWPTLDKAKKKYFQLCAAHTDAEGVNTATVMIVDEQLDVPEGCKQFISNAAQSE